MESVTIKKRRIRFQLLVAGGSLLAMGIILAKVDFKTSIRLISEVKIPFIIAAVFFSIISNIVLSGEKW